MAKETGIMSWKELELGIAITRPGNAGELKTGDWRSMRPVTDLREVHEMRSVLHFLPGYGVQKERRRLLQAKLLLLQRLRHLRP